MFFTILGYNRGYYRFVPLSKVVGNELKVCCERSEQHTLQIGVLRMHHLPDDIIFEIFRALPSRGDCVHLAQVARKYNNIWEKCNKFITRKYYHQNYSDTEYLEYEKGKTTLTKLNAVLGSGFKICIKNRVIIRIRRSFDTVLCEVPFYHNGHEIYGRFSWGSKQRHKKCDSPNLCKAKCSQFTTKIYYYVKIFHITRESVISFNEILENVSLLLEDAEALGPENTYYLKEIIKYCKAPAYPEDIKRYLPGCSPDVARNCNNSG